MWDLGTDWDREKTEMGWDPRRTERKSDERGDQKTIPSTWPSQD